MMPISSWQYDEDAAGARHLGPVAEDFRSAFGLSENDKSVGVTDLSGVSLAAAKALEVRTRELAAAQAELAVRTAKLERLETELAELRARMDRLERSAKH